jgi:hypothetical protein
MTGELLHGNWFLDLDIFHKGFARARDEDGWMHVDLRGRPIYARRFAAVEPFYNGQARVERSDSGLEVIDEQGQKLIELRSARQSEFAALSADMVGFWRTQAIAAAVRVGVIEALPCTSSALAAMRGLKVDGAQRLLRGLGELKIVECDAGIWRLSDRGEFLRANHPLTLADAALEYAGALGELWSCLPEALRQGGDWRAPDIFGDVARDSVRLHGHLRMLRSYARHDYALMPGALGLHGDEIVVDAGGGFGTLAKNILNVYPGVKKAIRSLRPFQDDVRTLMSIEGDEALVEFETFRFENAYCYFDACLANLADTAALNLGKGIYAAANASLYSFSYYQIGARRRLAVMRAGFETHIDGSLA